MNKSVKIGISILTILSIGIMPVLGYEARLIPLLIVLCLILYLTIEIFFTIRLSKTLVNIFGLLVFAFTFFKLSYSRVGSTTSGIVAIILLIVAALIFVVARKRIETIKVDLLLLGVFCFPLMLMFLPESIIYESFRPFYNVTPYEENYDMVFFLNDTPDAEIAGNFSAYQGKANMSLDEMRALLDEQANEQIYYLIGNHYLLDQQYQNAIDAYDSAINIDSNFAHAFNHRGIARLQLDKTKEAYYDFTTAIKIDSAYYEAYMNKAIIVLRHSGIGEACSDLEKVMKYSQNVKMNEIARYQMNRYCN